LGTGGIIAYIGKQFRLNVLNVARNDRQKKMRKQRSSTTKANDCKIKKLYKNLII